MTVIATDNFNRANGPLGANWTDVYNALAIVSNEVTGGTAADINASWRSAEVFPDDQYAQSILTASGQDGGPGVRVSGTSGATFKGYFIESFGGADRVIKFVNGVQTNLFDVDVPYSVADLMGIQIVGQLITALLNGAPNGSGSDGSIASGSGGQWNFSNTGRFNDWEAGSVGSGGATVLVDIPHSRQWQAVIAQ